MCLHKRWRGQLDLSALEKPGGPAAAPCHGSWASLSRSIYLCPMVGRSVNPQGLDPSLGPESGGAGILSKLPLPSPLPPVLRSPLLEGLH